MIKLFIKLKEEKLLKEDFDLLDLGCGNGLVSKPFFEFGCNVTLVDKNSEVLKKASENFESIKKTDFKTILSSIEDFEFNKKYDGIILSNVLPFQKSKDDIKNILDKSWDNINDGGFLYFTLFGDKDQWVGEYPNINFYNKEEAFSVLNIEPRYTSEDYGKGSTMKGDIKTWHLFSFLYIK